MTSQQRKNRVENQVINMEEMVKRVLEELSKLNLSQIINEENASINQESSQVKTFPVEASAKHIHLSQADVEALFGEGYTLTFGRALSQPGQFLANERVRLIGPKGVLENVAVLGPARSATQVEISISDSRQLGVPSVIRESGKVASSPGIIIATGAKVINIEEGVIVAKRHIHMSPAHASRLDVKDCQVVSVKINSARPLVFEDVLVRVNPEFLLSMHIDLDEANACALGKETTGEIV